MKLRITFVAVPVLALVVVAAAFAGDQRERRQASAERRRSPAARPARSEWPTRSPARLRRSAPQQFALGTVLRQEVECAEGEREAEDRDRPGRHAARRRHGVRRQGRAVVRVEPEGPRGRRPGRQPGGRRLDVRAPGRGARLGLRIRVPRLAHRRPHGRRQPAGLLLPDGAERRHPGPDGGELHPPQAQGPARLRHRRPGDLLAGARRQRPGEPQGSRASA